MTKKQSAAALAVLVVLALLAGFVLVNRGDGPVMGCILADRVIQSEPAYDSAGTTPFRGTYLVLTKQFNHYKKGFSSEIKSLSALTINYRVVEIKKGTA
ncbi:MAG: hypothetical protein N2376_06320 [Clostridia bacterium]|nr:hypothetical protein [Clostridia bacterium]